MIQNNLKLAVCGMLLVGSVSHGATLQVDQEKSQIQVDAVATGHDFTGKLKKYQADVAADVDPLTPSRFELNWNFADLKTDDDKRDAEMLKWLGDAAPKGAFKFTKSWTEKSGQQKAMGTLTIHGVSKTVSFPFTAVNDGKSVTIDGMVDMNYEDFGLPIVRAMMLLKVDSHLVVRFHVVGKIQ